jgi:hypothetical protein
MSNASPSLEIGDQGRQEPEREKEIEEARADVRPIVFL